MTRSFLMKVLIIWYNVITNIIKNFLKKIIKKETNLNKISKYIKKLINNLNQKRIKIIEEIDII